MSLDMGRAGQQLRDFAFEMLFIEELGWDRHRQTIDIAVGDCDYRLAAVAHKRFFGVFLCAPSAGADLPDYATRRRIDRELTKAVREHLIIFTDRHRTRQLWQWVKREAGKPAQCREFTYHTGERADLLLQRLDTIAVALDEEAELGLPDVTQRVRAAFDLEPVTKQFYEQFKVERDAFARFLRGIPAEGIQRWYVSVMLNRLMFIYFVQQKRFLDGDAAYLPHRLAASMQRGRDLFYRDFLCPLFFEGFARQPSDRDPEVAARLGTVPYLNGGLFLRHQIEEQYGDAIQIADAAFERIFRFFGEWSWHLDERPLRRKNEINPDVLGYIFEKYINQKQMGAYYTKEDITDYISRYTVIPFVFGAAEQGCRVAFEGAAAVWRLLQDDADRYIYPAVRHGAELPLPEHIAAGLDDVARRGQWNEPAPTAYALPTETWREVVARRGRHDRLRARLAGGEARSVNDVITLNLDICQFAQDAIAGCEGPDLLVAFWDAIGKVRILDPTCGSGAFLFAALNVMEPLYEACLDRMQSFLDEWGEAGARTHRGYAAQFRQVQQRVKQHPNRKYFVLKSIVVENLFGVDLMDEAVEICKLRLFLKLVAQVDSAEQIEPLPDIDFNVQAGNTLVGFAREADVEQAVVAPGGQMPLFLSPEQEAVLGRIHSAAARVKQKMAWYRKLQTEWGVAPPVLAAAKEQARVERQALNSELHRYLATVYRIDATDTGGGVYRRGMRTGKPRTNRSIGTSSSMESWRWAGSM